MIQVEHVRSTFGIEMFTVGADAPKGVHVTAFWSFDMSKMPSFFLYEAKAFTGAILKSHDSSTKSLKMNAKP